MTLPRSLTVIPGKEKQYISQLWNVMSKNVNSSGITSLCHAYHKLVKKLSISENLQADTELFKKCFWNKNKAQKKLQFLTNYIFPKLHTATFLWTFSRDPSNVQ